MPRSAAETTALETSFNRLSLDGDTIMLLLNVEETLRSNGNEKLADRLDKLQRDITGYYAGAEDAKPKDGEQTKTFVDGYEPLTPARVNGLLWEIEKSLADTPLAAEFSALAKEAVVAAEKSPAAKAPPPKPR